MWYYVMWKAVYYFVVYLSCSHSFNWRYDVISGRMLIGGRKARLRKGIYNPKLTKENTPITNYYVKQLLDTKPINHFQPTILD